MPHLGTRAPGYHDADRPLDAIAFMDAMRKQPGLRLSTVPASPQLALFHARGLTPGHLHAPRLQVCYNTYLRARARAGHTIPVQELMDQMRADHVVPDLATCVSTPTPSPHPHPCQRPLTLTHPPFLSRQNILLDATITAGQLESAQRRYTDMVARGEFDSYTVATMMRAYMNGAVPVFVKAVRVYRDALGTYQTCVVGKPRRPY